MEIFKAYDIRGTYPGEIGADTARKIGYATALYLRPKNVVIGYDVRKSSPDIAEACIQGVAATPCEVVNIGLVSTPCLYFSSASLGADCGIIITASHNPPEYTGFKICRGEAIPVGISSGLAEIKTIFDEVRAVPKIVGLLRTEDMTDVYRAHLKKFGSFVGGRRPRFVVDLASGAVSASFGALFDWIKEYVDLVTICDVPDGNFPNHEPDPLKDKNIADLQAKVVQTKADAGFAFDGDGDRLICVDETGRRVEGDIIACIMAQELAKRGDTIIYDVRSSKVVCEEMSLMGVNAVKERVGHAFIKNTMRAHAAVFGGELSGHYYFRDNYYADSGEIAFVVMAGILQRSNERFSQIAARYRRYSKTGEINFRVRDAAAALEAVKKSYYGCEFEELDGLSVIGRDFWFNVRPSNTEPLLRLNAEADNEIILKGVVDKISSVVGA